MSVSSQTAFRDFGSTSPEHLAEHRQNIAGQFGRTSPTRLPSGNSAKHRRNTRPKISSQTAGMDFSRTSQEYRAEPCQQVCIQDFGRRSQGHLAEHFQTDCIQGLRQNNDGSSGRTCPARLHSGLRQRIGGKLGQGPGRPWQGFAKGAAALGKALPRARPPSARPCQKDQITSKDIVRKSREHRSEDLQPDCLHGLRPRIAGTPRRTSRAKALSMISSA